METLIRIIVFGFSIDELNWIELKSVHLNDLECVNLVCLKTTRNCQFFGCFRCPYNSVHSIPFIIVSFCFHFPFPKTFSPHFSKSSIEFAFSVKFSSNFFFAASILLRGSFAGILLKCNNSRCCGFIDFWSKMRGQRFSFAVDGNLIKFI